MGSYNLDEELGVQQGDFRINNVDGSSWLGDLSLGRNFLSILIGCGFFGIVGLDTGQELFPAGGKSQMLNSDVNTLRNDSLPDLLVDCDSNGSRVHIEDCTSPSVVVLVGHALMDGTIDNDVNNIANLVDSKGLGDVNGPVLLESLSELMPGTASLSVAMSHV